MQTKHKKITVLAQALLILTLTALTTMTTIVWADSPTATQRIWAPTGDIIGTENHITGSFISMDSHGDPAKAAEDWLLMEQYSGQGLFSWTKVWDSGYNMRIRGLGDSSTGKFNSQFRIDGNKPGSMSYTISFRNARASYDQNSELRAPVFATTPTPPELAEIPALDWRKSDISLRHRLNDAFSMKLSFGGFCREGSKGSLLRGATGNAVPGLKTYEVSRTKMNVGVNYAGKKLNGDVEFSYMAADGDRTLDTRQVYEDDQKSWALRIGSRYMLNPKTTIQGNYLTSRLENKGTETRVTETNSDGETRTYAGQLGINSRLGQHWTVSLSGHMRQANTDVIQSDATDVIYGGSYDRENKDLQFRVVNTALKNTRVQLGYRFKDSTMEKAAAMGGAPGSATRTGLQTQDQDKQEHRVDFRARHRLCPKARLDLRVGYVQQEIDVTNAWDTTDDEAWFYTMGDRKVTRFSSQLMLKTRPIKTVRLDLGYRGFQRNFERTDINGVDNTWQAHRAMMNLNWMAHDRVTFYGMVSYGIEKYELNDDPVPAAASAPVMYDGTTIRFMPGVNVQVLSKLNVEAMYEGVRFEDKGNEPVVGTLESDHDRMLARARYTITDKYAATLTYQRREFFEHRWDNYIHDLYSVSLSGRF